MTYYYHIICDIVLLQIVKSTDGNSMQINRLFEIVHILLNKETVTAKELAERFEVSVRTVYRDIETLSASGIPIYMLKGRGGGISLMEGYILNKVVLSDSEKSEILSALQGLNAVNSSDSGTLSKVDALLGSGSSNWIEIDFSSWYNQEQISELFAGLKGAILSKNPVQFKYFNNKQERSVRIVEPLRLVFKEYAWYLFAYCRTRQDMRMFKLSRIKELTVLDEEFEREYSRPVLDSVQQFKEKFVDLKLKIRKEMAFRVFDEFDNSLITTDSNGDFLITMHYPHNSRWIFNYLMSFGESAEVLEPLPIREQIKERLKKVLQQYR